MKIYCPELTRERSIKTFLNQYFDKNSPSTYHADGSLDCKAGKNRSVEALYYLVKTEYPSVSFRKFIKVLSELAVERKSCILSCYQVGKYTFYRGGPAENYNPFFMENPLVRKFNRVGLFFNDDYKNGESPNYKIFGKYTNYDLYKIITND